MPEMKEVHFRGILIFRIPHDWVEEQESGGLGAYYLPTPDSGTLRVELLTLEQPGSGNATKFPSVMDLSKAGLVETLANGHLLKKRFEAFEERGVALRLSTWELARAYPPDHVRLAVFALTQREDSISQSPAQEELRMIDAEVRTASFIDLPPNAVSKKMD